MFEAEFGDVEQSIQRPLLAQSQNPKSKKPAQVSLSGLL